MFTCLCNPQLIDPVDFNLSTLEGRRKLLQHLKKKHLRKLKKYTLIIKGISYSYILYETGLKENTQEGYIFLHDETKDDLNYVVKFKRNISGALKSIIGHSITQVSVWRSVENPGPSTNITAYVFFKQLLPKLGTLASDFQQTDLGRQFWIRRISEAWQIKLNVYFVSIQPKRSILLDPISFSNLQKAGEIWGTTPSFKNKFLIITKEVLPTTE